MSQHAPCIRTYLLTLQYFLYSVVPHIKPFELDEAVFAGESVHLDCHVSKGDTPLNISWSFQGHPVSRRMGIKTTTLSERVSVLDIPSALGPNSGNYTCTAANRAGITTHTVLLNVIGTETLQLGCACFLFSSSCGPTFLFRRSCNEFWTSSNDPLLCY